MESVKKLISQHSDRYEEFDYYLGIIEKAEKNVASYPDISIESSKSLIEGISKSISKKLNPAYDANKTDLSQIVRDALQCLAKHDEYIENDFITRCVSLIHLLGEIRNKRGDISHGRHAPKDISSDIRLSKLAIHLTEGLVFYILTVFYSIDLSFKQLTPYEQNTEFNELLNMNDSLDLINYSKALYEQDYDYYVELLSEWKSKENENA